MLWIGTYEAKGGQGLYPLDPLNGAMNLGAPRPRIANASFGVWSPSTRTAYFVDEQDEGRVAAWARVEGIWEERGTQSTGGALPCYLSLHPGRGLIAAANYGDGSVALIEVDRATGRVGGLVDVARVSGKGVDPDRQDGPHAHCVLFDEPGQFLFHVDLGLDRVFRHRVEGGRLRDMEVAFEAPPGSGPRHLAFHPDGRHALLLTELSGELILLERTSSGLEAVHTVKTLPEPHDDNLGGHLEIGVDGRVFVTNRGHDSLVAFNVVGNRLERSGWVRTGEASPRHFRLSDGGVLVAHEEGGAVSRVPRPRPGMNGEGPTQLVPVPGAVFILEIPD